MRLPAAIATVILLWSCQSTDVATACEAWRTHLHGGTLSLPSDGSAFSEALNALARGDATEDEVALVFTTCADAGHPIIDSPHTGRED
jgi:hypothetical protein